jgi:hypothetical protein
MILQSKFAIRALDLNLSGAAGYAQHLVIVALSV